MMERIEAFIRMVAAGNTEMAEVEEQAHALLVDIESVARQAANCCNHPELHKP